MQLIYEGKDVTADVEIKKADITDNAGGIADSVELWFNDPHDLWSQWKPQKNDTLEINEDGFSSGLMYVDELKQKRGYYIVKALSIPQEAKTDFTKAWENVRLLELADEKAVKHGFQLITYGVEDNLYERVDQVHEADFVHLSKRCILEGCMLKLTSKKVVIYNERYMEAQLPEKIIYKDQFDGDYDFTATSTGIYSLCSITYGNIKAMYKPANGPVGPELKINDIYITSQGEGERFAKNILRSNNKNETSGYFTIQKDSGIAAGNMIELPDIGISPGAFFCTQVVHKLADGKTFIKVRKPLEEY
ncbi:MAG: phage late control D family protein [Caulobacteraceae bacterium]